MNMKAVNVKNLKKGEQERFSASERRNMDVFLDELDSYFAFPENEDLAIAIISKLKFKYHLLF